MQKLLLKRAWLHLSDKRMTTGNVASGAKKHNLPTESGGTTCISPGTAPVRHVNLNTKQIMTVVLRRSPFHYATVVTETRMAASFRQTHDYWQG